MTQSLQDLIQKIDKSKAQLHELRPIKSEYNTAICQKFQLEFNYHSNHIEGNTLTLGETKNLILRGMEVSIAKKFRDILEMKGHLDAYDTLGFLTERILTEDRLPLRLDQSFIKNLHKIIFVEDKTIHSEENGVQSVTTIPAGEYKKHQNHVITNTGAKFEYSEPWQVPQMMSDLLDWYNNNRETIHPAILASIFHYKFIRIHPFGDGNGRTARLLMNLILQSSGQVIAMVKSDAESKSSYLNALSLVDNNFIDIQECLIENNVDLFESFVIEIGNCLLSSYDIMIRGAKGEDITDAADIIKLAEIREIKNRAVEYTLREILQDVKLKQKVDSQLKTIQEHIENYFYSVLEKKFFNSEFYISDGGYNYFKNLSVNEKKQSYIFSFDKLGKVNITFDFKSAGYLVSGDLFSGIIIEFYYIDRDFETKLKSLIEHFDKFILFKEKNTFDF
jgi:Fic family protein